MVINLIFGFKFRVLFFFVDAAAWCFLCLIVFFLLEVIGLCEENGS